jgi:hypothetical protein
MSGVIVEEWKINSRGGALKGFAKVRMPSGVVYHGVLVFEQDGKCWASPPGKAQIAADGSAITKGGKPQFTPLMTFATPALRQLFSHVVCEAVRKAGAFDNGGAQ